MTNTLDSFESNSFKTEGINISEKTSEFNKAFDSKVKSTDGVFKNNNFDVSQTNVPDWLNIDTNSIKVSTDSVVSNVKQMYSGVNVDLSGYESFKTMGIKDVGNWKGDIKNKSILKSRAGYDAEIISTAKENITNEALGNGNKTYRADDRPDLFPRNDQYVDKIRVDSAGNITERIQTKFIGDDGASCYDKLINSKDFDKYFTDGKVDKIEIPKDYFKSAKEALNQDRASLENQIERLKADGKTEIAEQKQAKLDKVNQLDGMLEQSNTTSTEAIQAAKHPKLYAAKQMMPSVAKKGAMDGLNQAKTAMIVTGAMSTVDNVSKYLDGDIAAEEAVKNIAVDTGTAGAAAFSVGFITSSTATLMRSSSNELIKSVGSAGGGCLPAAAVSYGIEVHGAVVDYAKGEIDNAEFVDELGRSGAKVAGGMVGGAIGSAAGPVGSFAGASVGSEVGEAAYDATKYVADTAVDLATGEKTVEEVSSEINDAAIDKAEGIGYDSPKLIDELGRNGAKAVGGVIGGISSIDDGPIEIYKGVKRGEKIGEVSYDAIKYVANTTVDVALGEKNIEELPDELKNNVINKTKETINSTKERVEETTANVEKTVEKAKTTVENKATEVKKDVKTTTDKTVEKVKDYQQSAKELVSSTVNYAVTSEAYVSAVETCEGAIDSSAEQLDKLETKAKEYADKAIEKAGDFGADVVKDVKAAISNFNIKNSLPFNT